MSGQRLGVGIIGMRSIGGVHAAALTHCEDVEVVTVSGGEPGDAAAAGWPRARFVTPAEVLTDPGVDVVAVCSPSALHVEHALAALDAGKHVMVEKPVALDVAGAEAVAERARTRGLVAAVNVQRRFEPEHLHLKALLDSGRLGRVVLGEAFVHWQRDADYYRRAPWRASMSGGGGSLMNQGVHNVDLLRWLLGPVAEVTAQFATLGHTMDAEDTTVATLRFASGALGLFATSTATPPGGPAELSIHTAGGSVHLAQDGVRRWDVPEPPPPDRDDLSPTGARDPLAIGSAGHIASWRDVLTAVRDRRAPTASVQDSVQTVRLLCAVYEAARTGRAVRPETLR